MATGFARGKLLCAAVRLGIADALIRPMSVDHLAAEIDADPGALGRLLRALATIGILEGTAADTYALTALGGPLRRDAPDSVWASVVFWADLLADQWTYLDECVRAGEREGPARARTAAGVSSRWAREPEASAIFHAVFAEAGPEANLAYVEACEISSARVVADLGGAGGGLVSAILGAFPALRGVLADRPEALVAARERLAAAGLGDRCELTACDLVETVPAGADVYLMRSVLHGYEDPAATAILENCRAAIGAGGRLLVIECVVPDRVQRADPRVEAIAMGDLNMLAVTGGRERTRSEWESLLARAGFELVEVRPVGCDPASGLASDQHSVIEARPAQA